jgi:proteasome lid subunit RPN8/RPN11
MRLVLPEDVLAALEAAVCSEPCKEVCGFLVGIEERVEGFVRVANLAVESATFCVPRTELRRLELHVARAGQEILAFVHSHRVTPGFSYADRCSMNKSELPWVLAWNPNPVRTGELVRRSSSSRPGAHLHLVISGHPTHRPARASAGHPDDPGRVG